MAHIGRVTSGVTVGNLLQADTLTGGYGDSGVSAAAVQALLANPAGTGTVTSVSVSFANGFEGNVTNPTTTPLITLGTPLTGIVKGSGGSLVAATAGTDYQAPITLTTTGTSGAATLSGNVLNVPNYASGAVNSLTTTGTSGAATLTSGVLNVPNYGGAAKVTSVTGDGALYTNSSSTGPVTLTLGAAPANSVWGNSTGTSATPGYTAVPSVTSLTTNVLNVNGSANISTNLSIAGTQNNAFVVGQNGSTYPAFNVNTSNGSSVTGINVASNAAGGGVAVTTTSSASNEALTISSLGTGAVAISSPTGTSTLGSSTSGNTILSTAASGSVLMQFGGTTRDTNTGMSYSFAPTTLTTASTVRFLLTPAADTTLTASTEAPFFKVATAPRQHATGAVTLQRDNIIQGATHTAVAASTFTDTAGLALTLPLGGTNATLTNAHGLLIQSASLTGTTNGYGLNVSASTGATNNYAAKFVGPVVNGGTALSAAGGTGNGSVTPTMAGAQNGGTISFTTAGTPAASATVATVTYSSPFPTGSAVILYPANAATALLTGASGVSAVGSTTGYTITSGTTGLVTGTAYAWNYQVIGY